jgi:hypothetical protein
MQIIKIFVVFHKVIDEIIFQHFSSSEIDSWFIKYGVNQTHSKRIKYRNPLRAFAKRHADRNLILEYELSSCNPLLQTQGFMEGSCYSHVNSNKLFENADYIGVCQYDMRWTKEASNVLRDLAHDRGKAGKNVWGISVGSIKTEENGFHKYAFPDLLDWAFILKSYNRHFSTSWDIEILVDKPFSLYQTYVLPTDEFVSLSTWLNVLMSELYPWANQPPYPVHWGHLAGCIERASSLYIAARIHEQQITFNLLPLDHDESISKRLGVEKKHYGL